MALPGLKFSSSAFVATALSPAPHNSYVPGDIYPALWSSQKCWLRIKTSEQWEIPGVKVFFRKCTVVG